MKALAGNETVADNLLRCLTACPSCVRTSSRRNLPCWPIRNWRSHPGRSGADLASITGPPAAIAGYLDAEQAPGRIRAWVDVSAVAIVLLAMLFGLAVSAVPTVAVCPALAGSPPSGPTVDVDLMRTAVAAVVDGIANHRGSAVTAPRDEPRA